jgi:uncharacterized phage protein (TIGR01671 family)
MREIKFRAWCDKTKRWVNPKEIKLDLSNGYTNIPVLLIQYTGLKDRKGYDVYEGDILSHWHTGVYSIVWNDGQYCRQMISVPENKNMSPEELNLFIMPSDIKYATLIGNIYENPELLTKN